jgi:hypothetical protein
MHILIQSRRYTSDLARRAPAHAAEVLAYDLDAAIDVSCFILIAEKLGARKQRGLLMQHKARSIHAKGASQSLCTKAAHLCHVMSRPAQPLRF